MSAPTSDRTTVDEPRFREALRTLPRRVWIVSLGILVNQVGNFLPVFIVLYLIERGHSAGTAGLVLGAAGLGNVLGNALGGHLADRIGRRWTIVLSAVATSGLVAAVPQLGSLPALFAVVGLAGVTSHVYRPAAAAVLVASVDTNRQRLAAFGVFRAAQNIGAALGGVLGGLLATVSYTGLFLGNAATCLLFGVVIAILLWDAPARGQEQEVTEAPVEEAGGYRRALRDRVFLRFLLMTVFAEFVYVQSTVGVPLHVSDVGLTARHFGLLIGLNGLLVLTLELPATALVSSYRPERVLAVGNLLVGLGLALTGLVDEMALLAVMVMVWTVGEMITSSVAYAYLGGLTPRGMVGRYQGLHGVAYTIGTGAGPIVGGAAYAVSPSALWVVIAIAGLLSAQLALPPRRRARVEAPQEVATW